MTDEQCQHSALIDSFTVRCSLPADHFGQRCEIEGTTPALLDRVGIRELNGPPTPGVLTLKQAGGKGIVVPDLRGRNIAFSTPAHQPDPTPDDAISFLSDFSNDVTILDHDTKERICTLPQIRVRFSVQPSPKWPDFNLGSKVALHDFGSRMRWEFRMQEGSYTAESRYVWGFVTGWKFNAGDL